jgi:hypothetical protein
MRKLAEHILDSKAAAFDPATFRDRYEEPVALFSHRQNSEDGILPFRPIRGRIGVGYRDLPMRKIDRNLL